jgi:hypothetical protein
MDGTGRDRKEGKIMPQNEIIVSIVALAGAVLLISFWRQILFILLFGMIVVFCFGLYNVVAVARG